MRPPALRTGVTKPSVRPQGAHGALGAHPDGSAAPGPVGHNVQTIAALSARIEGRVGRHQRAIEHFTDVVGRPATTYLIVLLVLIWTIGNGVAGRLGLRALDPSPFPLLQGAVTIAALLMAVGILTTQNRLAKLTEQRAHLDLQVNLVAEQKVAKLIALIEELRRDLPSVANRRDSLAEAMTEALDPHAVAEELETIERGKRPGA